MSKRFRFDTAWNSEIFFIPTVGFIHGYMVTGKYKYRIGFAWLGFLFSIGFCKKK